MVRSRGRPSEQQELPWTGGRLREACELPTLCPGCPSPCVRPNLGSVPPLPLEGEGASAGRHLPSSGASGTAEGRCLSGPRNPPLWPPIPAISDGESSALVKRPQPRSQERGS